MAGYRFAQESHVELAHGLISRLETNEKGKLRSPVYEEGSFYSYDPPSGIWRRIEELEAGQMVQEFDGHQAGGKQIKVKDSDVKGALQCARRQLWQRDSFFSEVPPGLVFKDCFVRVTPEGVVEKLPHASEHKARYAYDFDYVEEPPERFLEALGGMFQCDADIDAKIQCLGEFGGCSLLGAATRLQRWVLLRGDGDDGKSTLIEMIRSAFPPGSCSSIKPEDLEDEYERADLAGKLLNTVTEVAQNQYLKGETLKAMTVGDMMRGRPIRQAPISFRPLAGLLMAANGYPKFSDSSHGFWRRPIVITFNHRFTHDPTRDPLLATRIVSAERQRIVCWLVRQGAAALARGRYVEPESHFEALREWRGETDAVFEFVQEMCVVASKQPVAMANGWSPPTALYLAFNSWCSRTGHRPMSSTAFGRRLTALGYHEERGAKGVRLRPLRPLAKGEFKDEHGNIVQSLN